MGSGKLVFILTLKDNFAKNRKPDFYYRVPKYDLFRRKREDIYGMRTIKITEGGIHNISHF